MKAKYIVTYLLLLYGNCMLLLGFSSITVTVYISCSYSVLLAQLIWL